MSEFSFPKDRIQITLMENVHESAVEVLSRAGYNTVEQIKGGLEGDELKARLAHTHILGIRSRTQLTHDVLHAAPKLMAVGCFCIGTNQVDLDAACALGIPVFNAPHANTRSVAELVLAEIVMLCRRLGDRNNEMHRGVWQKALFGSCEVRGKTLGIVGYGHIGSQVSILAESFGMRVLYHDIEPKLAMGNAQQVGTLDELLQQVDLLTLHVPDLPETRNLIGLQEMARMKQGSMLINASRGGVVDLLALKANIDRGHLAGAALDVFPVEPKANNEPFVHPLQNTPNVVLTPHMGGNTAEAQKNIGLEVARKLVGYSDWGSSIGAVNFPELSLPAHAGAHRVLHIHRNQPGVLGAINRALAESGANVAGQHLQTRGDVGYVVIDIEASHHHELHERLRAVPGTIKCRVLY